MPCKLLSSQLLVLNVKRGALNVSNNFKTQSVIDGTHILRRAMPFYNPPNHFLLLLKARDTVSDYSDY